MKKTRTYYRLALTGIAKNFRMYVPYLLTCSGMVMICYILEFLSKSGHVAALRGGDTLQTMFSFGTQVFGMFALIFLFYTNSFLIRSRKREFGLYNVLGMGKKNLARVLVWENVLIAGVSMLTGLFCGILFSKLAELWIARVASGETVMELSIEPEAVKNTTLLFLGVFALILLQALIQIGRAKPVELLKSEAVGEKPPKANWFLAVLGLMLLGGAYYVAVSIEDPLSAVLWFFLAVAVVIAATYLLFIAGSVALCRLLQRNKKYYYRVDHFVSVSSMAYRMKRNGAGLASICILSTMALVMVSAVTCLYVGSEDALRKRYPTDLAVKLRAVNGTDTKEKEVESVIQDALKQCSAETENMLDYHYISVEGIRSENKFVLDAADMDAIGRVSDIRAIYFIPLEDYNRIEGKQETLAENEVLVYSPHEAFEYDTIRIQGCQEWSVKSQVPEFQYIENGVGYTVKLLFVFLPDMSMADGAYEIQPLGRQHYYGFDVSLDDEGQRVLAEQIQAGLKELQGSEREFPNVSVESRAADRERFHSVNGGLFVIGVLLGSVFLVAMILLMYYKQITEGYEDQAKFDIMQKVGMTEKEIRASIRSQMFTVFFAPLLLAGLHTACAFPMVQKLLILLGAMNKKLLMTVTSVCFLVFALFYMAVYLVTSRSYYRIVSKKQ